MTWIISLLWIWSLSVAIGFISYDSPQIKRFAIVLTVAIPIIAYLIDVV